MELFLVFQLPKMTMVKLPTTKTGKEITARKDKAEAMHQPTMATKTPGMKVVAMVTTMQGDKGEETSGRRALLEVHLHLFKGWRHFAGLTATFRRNDSYYF